MAVTHVPYEPTENEFGEAFGPTPPKKLKRHDLRRHDLGGEGSGNFGHAGRVGEVGGSAPGGVVSRMAALKDKYPIVAKNYARHSGTEMGSIEEHTKDVGREWQTQLSRQELAAISERFGLDVGALMDDAIPLHDIGKPDALAAGEKETQHTHTVPILQDVLTQEGHSAKGVALATELLNHDMIGPLLRGYEGVRSAYTGKQVAEKLEAKAKKVGMATSDFAKLQLAFFQADASAYPYVTQFMHKDASGKWVFKNTKLAPIEALVSLSFDLGNENSGNYGHAGRPGEVGGSAPARDVAVLRGVDADANAARETERHLANWEAGSGERPTPDALKAAEAELRALPLVHGTTVAGALGALEDGLLSHADMQGQKDELKKAAFDIETELIEMLGQSEAWRIMRGKYADGQWTSSQELAEQLGLERRDTEMLVSKLNEIDDITKVLDGTTNMADVRLGLNEFVFMTHGAKHQDYGTVGVIIDNDVLNGGFATEHDIVRTPGIDPSNAETYTPEGVTNYQNGIVKGDGYYQTAAAKAGSADKLLHRTRDDLFEVKASGVPAKKVLGFVVEDDFEEAQRLADRLAAKGITGKVLFLSDMSYKSGPKRQFLHDQLKSVQATGGWDEDALETFREEHFGTYIL